MVQVFTMLWSKRAVGATPLVATSAQLQLPAPVVSRTYRASDGRVGAASPRAVMSAFSSPPKKYSLPFRSTPQWSVEA